MRTKSIVAKIIAVNVPIRRRIVSNVSNFFLTGAALVETDSSFFRSSGVKLPISFIIRIFRFLSSTNYLMHILGATVRADHSGVLHDCTIKLIGAVGTEEMLYLSRRISSGRGLHFRMLHIKYEVLAININVNR